MIQIDPEFAALCPPIRAEEYALLEASILEEGCREALITWNDLLLDGHNRKRICDEHGLYYDVAAFDDLPDRDAAIAWILRNQLGRRNLHPDAASLIRGRLYNMQKKTKAEAGALGGSSKDQNDTCLFSTAKRLADETGVSEATIKRDGEFANAVEELALFMPELPQKVMEGATASRQAVVDEAAKVSEAKKTNAVYQPVAATIFSHKSIEYYTPAEILDAVRKVIGEIDLDPASCVDAQENVQAVRFYTKEDDGLSQPWRGKVFLNPPYGKTKGKSSQCLWAERLVEEYRKGNVIEAILLVKAALGYVWFEDLFKDWPVCFLRSRLSFILENGDDKGQSKQGTAIFYFGPSLAKFVETFREYGRIIPSEEELDAAMLGQWGR